MSMRLDRYRFVLIVGAVISASCALAACGGSGESRTGGPSGAGAGGSSGAGSGGAGGADTGGAAGTGTTADECALDETQRALVEIEAQRALAQASWIVTQTHGSGMFASRAFGFPLPFTTAAALATATLMQACDGETVFDEYCTPGDEVQSTPGNCSQLRCLASGVLQVTTRIDPLPATVAAEPPPGDIEFEQAHQSVTFTEQADGSIAIEWLSDFDLTLADGTPFTSSETADALIGEAGVERNSGELTLVGLSSEALLIEYVTVGGETTGAGTLGGEQLLEVTHDGVTWTDACDP